MSISRMSDDLPAFYRAYIDCLNRRALAELGTFVHDEVVHNGRRLGMSGYRGMLEEDVRQIPDLRFTIDLLVCDAATVAARLLFDCTPAGAFLGLAVDGRRIAFAENVFYAIRDRKIATVWSVIDKATVASQLT